MPRVLIGRGGRVAAIGCLAKVTQGLQGHTIEKYQGRQRQQGGEARIQGHTVDCVVVRISSDFSCIWIVDRSFLLQ